MIILALDLGTKTGWAHVNHQGAIASGTVTLANRAELKAAREEQFDRRFDPRFPALLDFLCAREQTLGKPDLIFFEDVLFSEYTYQTQLWSSLRAAVWAYKCIAAIQEIECLDTSGLKKFATGNGAATKRMMAAFLRKKFPNEFHASPTANPKKEQYLASTDGRIVESDEVDARHLLDYAMGFFAA